MQKTSALKSKDLCTRTHADGGQGGACSHTRGFELSSVIFKWWEILLAQKGEALHLEKGSLDVAETLYSCEEFH